MTDRKLVALYSSVRRDRRIVFRYKDRRWEFFESMRPWDIREALRVSLKKIEEAVPESISKAAAIDDKNWQSTKLRRRRYIAESRDLLYIESPHLRSQAEPVAGHYVLTNISWAAVPEVLRLACKGANIEYGALSNITF